MAKLAQAELASPWGALTLGAEPRLVAAGGERARDRFAAGLATLPVLDPAIFVVPALAAGGEALVWKGTAAALRPVSALLPRWQARAAATFHQVVALAERLLALGDHPTAPACAATLLGRPGSADLQVLVVPALTTSLDEWAASDPVFWRWTSPRTLLTGAPDPAWTVAAALHDAVAGGLWPADLSAEEAFQRVLRGHVGQRRRLERTMTLALPKGLHAAGDALSRLILEGLSTAAEPRPWPAVRADFAVALAGLATDLRAEAWAADQDGALAGEILFEQANVDASTPPADQVRALLAIGRHEQAFAVVDRVAAERTPEAAELVADLLELCGPERLAELPKVRVEALLDHGYGSGDERVRLRLAEFEGRRAGRPVEAAARLGPAFKNGWFGATAALLQGRLECAAQRFPETSRTCAEAERRFKRLPAAGEAMGAYGRAYARLLDGTANFGFVAESGEVRFFLSAFRAFAEALAIAPAEERALRGHITDWLAWLGTFSELFTDPALPMLRLGIDATLAANGVGYTIRSGRGVPEIPWPDVDRLAPDPGRKPRRGVRP